MAVNHLLSRLVRFASGVTLSLLMAGSVTSCIEPPLKLPAEGVMLELPIVELDLDVVWNIDVDWRNTWYYGWDDTDRKLWGEIAYPQPSNYELRRYYLGSEPSVPHNDVDAHNIIGNRFRSHYKYGYYDLLLWSNIDSDDGTQVVVIDEKNIDEVQATTTVTRGMSRVGTSVAVTQGTSVLTGTSASTVVTGLYNQPEIFYSDYIRNLNITHNLEDYDYYDEQNHCYVKKVSSLLEPLVYIYLVQVIIYNNNGKIRSCTGDNAISSFASGTSVNTGHTWNKPVMVYFGSRMKKDIEVNGEKADIIGGKLTTYGLCDMDCYSKTRGQSQYTGSRTELINYLYFDVVFSNGTTSTIQVDVTDQCQQQAHGGVITVEIDARTIEPPVDPDSGSGSLFVPTVEDYDEVVFDLIM